MQTAMAPVALMYSTSYWLRATVICHSLGSSMTPVQHINRTVVSPYELPKSLTSTAAIQLPTDDTRTPGLAALTCCPSLRVEMVGAAVTLGVAAAATAWGPSDAAQSPVAPKATQLSVRPLRPGGRR